MRHILLCGAFGLAFTSAAPAQTWRGIPVAPESRCSPYDSSDYRYSQSVEDGIIRELGGKIQSPYTDQCFGSKRDTDIEHIVARSEAHDSGMCSASNARRRVFANDPLNLTLASPAVNRHAKRDKDAAEWMPDRNRCWFANRVVEVRRKYGLTIDRREADALERVLATCRSTAAVLPACADVMTTTPPSPRRSAAPAAGAPSGSPLARYDDNGNGRITCAEARRHGIAPVHRGHPAYVYMNDRDGDGVVCE